MAPIRSETDRKSGRVLFRSGGVALRADRLLPVGRRLLVKRARLLVLGAVAPDQLHGADPLRDMGVHLPLLVLTRTGVAAEPLHQELHAEDEEGGADEGDEGEAPRGGEEDRGASP